MRPFARFASAIAIALALPSGALAQANEQTAKEIRGAIKTWIDENLHSASGTYMLELDGQIAVVPDGPSYRVSLPAGRVVVPDQVTFRFGETGIALTPMDNGWYDARWQLPDSYRIEPAQGPGDEVRIGSQSGHGIFAPEYQAFMSVDAELQTVIVGVSEGAPVLTIDSITLVERTTEVAPGVHDLQSTLRLDNLVAKGPAFDGEFVLRDVEIGFTGEDQRLAELAELDRKLEALTRSIDSAQDPNQVRTDVEALASFINAMPSLFTGIAIEARHGPFWYRLGADTLDVSESAITVSVDAEDPNRTQVAFAARMDDAVLSNPNVAPLLPTDTRFRLAITDLPHRDLMDISLGVLEAGTVDPAMVLLIASDSVLQALSSADSTLEIGPILLATDNARVELEGVLRPDALSPLGFTGEVDMVAAGLDALISDIRRTGGDPDTIQFLTLVQTLGAQAPETDGRSVRTYAFRLDSTGTMLLNGSDIRPLIGGRR